MARTGKRRPISKMLRFEVLKRDSFTCQYCGAKSPDVLLQVDHILPVSSGGETDILNLVTACASCNLGKSDRKLSDSSALKKQHLALEELQARREQIEMMVQWQRDLLRLEQVQIDAIAELWSEMVYPFCLTAHGRETLNNGLKKFSAQEIIDAMRTSVDTYLVTGQDNEITPESAETAWKKVWGICATKRREVNDPLLKDIYYIRKILTNRFGRSVDQVKTLILIRSCLDSGFPAAEVADTAKTARSLAEFEAIFRNAMPNPPPRR